MIVNTICYVDIYSVFSKENLRKIGTALGEAAIGGYCNIECLRTEIIIGLLKEINLILSKDELEKIEAIKKLDIKFFGF